MSRTPSTTTALPDYLEDRNVRAVEAGLSIEKQKLAGPAKLTTWYRGTIEQFVRSGMLLDAEAVRRSTRQTINCFSTLLHVYSPLRHAYHVTLYRVGPDELRLVVSNERLPADFAVIRNGIKVYWYERGWAHRRTMVKVYVGTTRLELVESGVATAKILTDDAEHRPVGHGPKARRELLWRVEEDRGGAVMLETYPAAIARAASRGSAFEGSRVPPMKEQDYERAQGDAKFQAFLAQLQSDASGVE
ncbi:MAG TPA: hypothetical protein VNT02_00225 [Burkholderiales bacterium]|nr:hypothetical protein [Burkholderiales bacterium]